jgi:hypothetical protein|nr:MAG TPA: hypothetical protein [Caudoviricetes sp.]
MSTYIRAVVAAEAIADKHGIPLGDLVDTFADIPAADVAPVVHCKDCRLRGREECAMFYRCECGEQHTWETDNDFCSYGERL